MARRRVDFRGVRFGVEVDEKGYEWQPAPRLWRSDRDALVLAPAGLTGSGEDSTTYNSGEVRRGYAVYGFEVARKAFNRFRSLAEDLANSELSSMTEVRRGGASHDGQRSRDKQWVDDVNERRRLIAEYADEFGSLWGYSKFGTLDDWRQAAIAFLALYDAAQALKPGEDSAAFSRRLRIREDRPNSIMYLDTPIAYEAADERGELYRSLLAAGPRQQARMALNAGVNEMLEGGLSWQAPLTSDREATIKPRHLIHLLYLRLWMDTVEADELERQTTCLNCNAEITGTRRKKFCDDKCRAAYNNRLRARS